MRRRAMTNPNIQYGGFLYPDESGEHLDWFPMTKQEQLFAGIVMAQLRAGRIPGPTFLNFAIGRKRDNKLHGRMSKIRRAIFQGAGLVKDHESDRWKWPDVRA